MIQASIFQEVLKPVSMFREELCAGQESQTKARESIHLPFLGTQNCGSIASNGVSSDVEKD